MENTVKTQVMALRLDELTLREKILAELRAMNLGQRATKEFCENDLGYSVVETRSILAQLGLILTSEQMTSEDPVVQAKIDKLREWRSQRARREAVPAYRVLTNKIIMKLASECPRDTESLRAVKGMGEKMSMAYGPEIVELLKC